MSIINEFENEIAKAHFIEQTIRNNTIIRDAVDELAPLLTALDAQLPEPYKTDLAEVLKVWNTIETYAHAQKTNAVSDAVASTPSVNLQPPVDVNALAADAAAAEINAQAHAATDSE